MKMRNKSTGIIKLIALLGPATLMNIPVNLFLK